jgi:predicted CXXCH cytochrome family protein
MAPRKICAMGKLAAPEVVWSNSCTEFGVSGFQFNALSNCIRCHDGRGYANFTKGVGTNTVGMISASQNMVSCQACHDPHGGPNPYQLRSRPTNSDTLATGYHYTAETQGMSGLP